MLAAPKLPYKLDSLAPHMSKETLEFHYGKHHMSYFNNLAAMIDNKSEFDGLDALGIAKKSEQGVIFNNAAQIINHSFFWDCLTPDAGNRIRSEALNSIIDRDFGSFNKFKELFSLAAAKNFGSGWTWLVLDNNKLKIESTSNAQTPLISENKQVLLTIDVWEHAYYIDYRNLRPDYIKAFWEIVDWQFVAKMLNNQ